MERGAENSGAPQESTVPPPAGASAQGVRQGSSRGGELLTLLLSTPDSEGNPAALQELVDLLHQPEPQRLAFCDKATAESRAQQAREDNKEGLDARKAAMLEGREPPRDYEVGALRRAVIALEPDNVRKWLTAGVDPNSEQEYLGHWPPLHYAAQGGSLEIVRMLLQHGADRSYAPPRTADSVSNDETALVLAAYWGHKNIVEELCQGVPLKLSDDGKRDGDLQKVFQMIRAQIHDRRSYSWDTEEMFDARSLCAQIDDRNSVTTEEFVNALQMLEMGLTKEQETLVAEFVDNDQDNRIDYEDFLRFILLLVIGDDVLEQEEARWRNISVQKLRVAAWENILPASVFLDIADAHQLMQDGFGTPGYISVLCSTPELSVAKDFNIMKMIEYLCTRREYSASLFFGYDWAGSSTTSESDSNPNRVVPTCCLSLDCMCKRKSPHKVRAPVDWSDAKSVAGSAWFPKYVTKVKSTIVAYAGPHSTKETHEIGGVNEHIRGQRYLEVLTIHGGPVSQLEARTMPGTVHQAVKDLQSRNCSVSFVSEKKTTSLKIFVRQISYTEFIARFDQSWLAYNMPKTRTELLSMGEARAGDLVDARWLDCYKHKHSLLEDVKVTGATLKCAGTDDPELLANRRLLVLVLRKQDLFPAELPFLVYHDSDQVETAEPDGELPLHGSVVKKEIDRVTVSACGIRYPEHASKTLSVFSTFRGAQSHPDWIMQIDKAKRESQERVRDVLARDGCALARAPSAIKKDKDLVLVAINQAGSAIRYAAPELWEDREVLLAAVAQDGCALAYPKGALTEDREVVRAAVQQDGAALRYAAEPLKSDKDVVMAAVLKDGSFGLNYAAPAIRGCKTVVLAAVEQDGDALRYAENGLAENRDIVLAAVRQNGLAVRHMSESLSKDMEIALEAVAQNGLALRYLPWFTENEKVVLTAVKQNGLALEFAPEEQRQKQKQNKNKKKKKTTTKKKLGPKQNVPSAKREWKAAPARNTSPPRPRAPQTPPRSPTANASANSKLQPEVMGPSEPRAGYPSPGEPSPAMDDILETGRTLAASMAGVAAASSPNRNWPGTPKRPQSPPPGGDRSPAIDSAKDAGRNSGAVPVAVMPAPEVVGVTADGTPGDLDERGNSVAAIAAAVTQGIDNSAELDISHAQFQTGPVSTELLERIDALYAELKLEAVRDLLDESLAAEKDSAAVVQLRQFRASVLYSMGDVKGCLGEYIECVDVLSQEEQTEEVAEQMNQFWATRSALNNELGDHREAEICLEEAESNGMLKKEAERLGADIIAGYKEDAAHYDQLQSMGEVPEEFRIKVKTTAAVQKVSEMEQQGVMVATERATQQVEESGVDVEVEVPEGAVGGQQVPCQVGAGMPAHMTTIPPDANSLEDLSEERLEEFVKIMSEAVDAGRTHPQLTVSCLAKRAMHYLLLGKLEQSLEDLANLLSITQHKPVEEDPTAAEAFIMSGFVHRLCVMKYAMQETKEAMKHEQKAGAAFAAATKLGVENHQESISMLESEIQRSPKVRAIVEQYQKVDQSRVGCRGNVEIVRAAMTSNVAALKFASEALKRDSELMLDAVTLSPDAMSYVSQDLRKDEEFMLKAVGINGHALRYASKDFLKKNKVVVLEAAARDLTTLYWVTNRKTNTSFWKDAVRAPGVGEDALQFASKEQTEDYCFMKAMVRSNGLSLKYAATSLKTNKDLVLKAVSRNPLALEYAHNSLRSDSAFLQKAATTNATVLKHALPVMTTHCFQHNLVVNFLSLSSGEHQAPKWEPEPEPEVSAKQQHENGAELNTVYEAELELEISSSDEDSNDGSDYSDSGHSDSDGDSEDASDSGHD